MNTKLFKKNKFTFFIIIFFLIVFALLYPVKALFFPDGGAANYGDRLDGLKEITTQDLTSLEEEIKKETLVKEVKTDKKGRILNVILTLEKDVSLKNAKEIASTIKDYLKEEILNEYDIQVFMKKEEPEENNFPIIGYKSNEDAEFSFTKDREKKIEEKEEGEE